MSRIKTKTMTEMTNAEPDLDENIHLNKELIDFSGSKWTVRNAVEGVQIFGGIGSGKTSGSGRHLALKYLSNGFGGLVLTVKPDEKELWEEYCTLTGRNDDLVIVEDGRENYFNFLEHESENGDTANSNTENIVQVLKTVLRASEEKASGAKQDPFWETSLDMLIFNVIDLCKLAYGSVTVQQMYDIVQSLPRKGEENNVQDSAFLKAMIKVEREVKARIEEWKNKQSVDEWNKFSRDAIHFDTAVRNALPEARLFGFVQQFFKAFLTLSEKTRSIIDFSFAGFLFRLLRDPVYSLFCRHTSSFRPEDCLKGKIILLNLPVKLYHKVGQDCQIMFKYIWQRAMEKRRVGRDGIPVFLWADEAQNFLHEYDADYQATARSSMIATVYLSQNLPNYHANMGGNRSEYRVKSFLGTLATKIFHANADIETNKYASELIGDWVYKDISITGSIGTNQEFSGSRSTSLKIDRRVRPEDFLGLQTGGGRNEDIVTAYIHFQGNVLDNGRNYTQTAFHQKHP